MVTQFPPAPGLLRLIWELTRVAVQERRKMFVIDIKLSDMTGPTETIWDWQAGSIQLGGMSYNVLEGNKL